MRYFDCMDEKWVTTNGETTMATELEQFLEAQVDDLKLQLRDLQQAVLIHLSGFDPNSKSYLEELLEDYEPTESDQGLIPIPEGYNEQ